MLIHSFEYCPANHMPLSSGSTLVRDSPFPGSSEYFDPVCSHRIVSIQCLEWLGNGVGNCQASLWEVLGLLIELDARVIVHVIFAWMAFLSLAA